jgi:hypothetical protein
MKSKETVKKILANFTPEQRGLAESIATLKAENKLYYQQLSDLKEQHADLWKLIITILAMLPKKELRFHKSQFLRFKEEYRVLQTFEGDEVVLTLKTLTD